MPTTQTTQYLQNYGDGQYGTLAYPNPAQQGNETTAVNRALTPLPPPVFTGMKLQEDILLGDLVLNAIDENNVIWVCTDIEGWWVHPDPDIPDVPRGWRDGSYDARGRWQARQITLNGVFLPPEPDYIPAARSKLIEATTLVYSGTWLRTRENPTRAAWVRLSGRPEIKTVNARGRTEFSIGLRAADPVKYSWNDGDVDGYDVVTIPCKNMSTSQVGAATITNVGNTPVSVFFEITGPTTGSSTIYNATTEELITVTDTLRAQEVETVTAKERTGGVATLTFSTTHTSVIGDTVVVTGVDVDSAFNGTYVVTGTPTTSKISYANVAPNVTLIASSGTVTRAADVVEIDTYERDVAINGDRNGARAALSTLVDWMVLEPGANIIYFSDLGTPDGLSTLKVYYRSGWIG